MTAINKHTDGQFCWNQIATPDVDKAIVFYSALFGWEIVDEDLGHGDEMVRMLQNGEFVIGIHEIQEDEKAHWEPYLAMSDLSAFLSLVQEHGGFVVEKPQNAGQFGSMAEVCGPDGGRLCLWSAGTFGGHTNSSGQGIPRWYELQLLEEGPEETFWPTVLDWTEASNNQRRRNYANAEGTPIAQIHILNETEAENLYQPRWIAFVQVEDVDTTCKDAEAIEGTIVRRPYEAPGLGRCAVLADPQGSVFGIIEPS